ncbi:hypothetical protein ACPOLB_26495 [Rubrivivax sp. RP6-9]|uniref:hypothetical protein n=1 Tax=Rubrivivax sp. RP6-9 TaxID=3415750 RepID=UPI003CC5ECB5
MSNWLIDAQILWTCSNAVWAEPSADLMVRKLLKMRVVQDAEILVAGDRDLFIKAQELNRERPGSGTKLMAEKEKLTRKLLTKQEMESKGERYKEAELRLAQLKAKRDKELKDDAHSFMNSCGVCAGYTLFWLANAMQGMARTKPEQRLAAECQGYLMTRWSLTDEFSRFAIGKAPDRAAVYRKALKQMTMWRTSVVETESGLWDWQAPGLGTSDSKVFVQGSGAKRVWASVRAALKGGGGALLSIQCPGSGGKTVGHALGFYREKNGGSVLAFDANYGLGLYRTKDEMPAALEKLRACYEIEGLQTWTVYSVGVDDAVPIFVERL